jgi:hypothetical protein
MKLSTIMIVLAVIMMFGCDEKPVVVVGNTPPVLYIPQPKNMIDEDSVMRAYEPTEPIILSVNVVDTEDTVIDQTNIIWTLSKNGNVGPLEKGYNLKIEGGDLPEGTHEILAMYKDSDGAVGGASIYIRVKGSLNKSTIKRQAVKTKGYTGFVINTDDTVTDMSTGLTWMVCDDGYTKTLSEAMSAAKKRGSGWSVPTSGQWTTIIDKTILAEPFRDSLKAGESYWTKSAPKDREVAGKKVAHVIRMVKVSGQMRASMGIKTIDDYSYAIFVRK